MTERMFTQPSVDQGHFAQAPSAQVTRSRFDRSHGLKTTMDFDDLVPVFVDEVLPGDTFHLSSTMFARLATPLRPTMDNSYIDVHYFFVPYRLIWDNWQKFMGERINPDDDPDDYSMPQVTIDLTSLTGSELACYMGIPPRTGVTGVSVSALPFRAYSLIYNEWYRDQNLQSSQAVPKTDGPDPVDIAIDVFKRNKRHDYFTSCLPWPQKGDPVLIPISPRAPVTGLGIDFNTTGATSSVPVRETGWETGDPATTYPTGVYANTTGVLGVNVDVSQGAQVPQIYAQLAEATAVTINDLRAAWQIQVLLERDARGGTRYIELIKNHFQVVSSDHRLQRPEMLGGGTTRININPIASTFAGGTIAQGDLGGVGTAVNNAGFTKSFEEHGIIIGIASARADLTYQQGIERFWFRRTRYDHYWTALANLGEQAVLNREIFVQGTAADTEVFGYQERYAEYRYKPSRITGLFNSGVTASLDVWHLSEEFSGLPLLNDSFIKSQTPVDRIVAVTTEPHLLVDMWFKLDCQRPMPIYAIPSSIGGRL